MLIKCIVPKFWQTLYGELGHLEQADLPRFASARAPRGSRLVASRGKGASCACADAARDARQSKISAVNGLQTVSHPLRFRLRVLSSPIWLDLKRAPLCPRPASGEVAASCKSLRLRIVAPLRSGHGRSAQLLVVKAVGDDDRTTPNSLACSRGSGNRWLCPRHRPVPWPCVAYGICSAHAQRAHRGEDLRSTVRRPRAGRH